MLWQITAPHFVASLITEDDIVVQAAPILKWAVGLDIEDVARCADSERWKLTTIVPRETDRGVRGQ
ncbi:hypothetical protein UFOVP1244_85 [uncultured Caudovirales phage]|uniref:Uncharacterized protein n=1 Tax=uncultured Caudovirales phage TaxID=2100421 RepID=A0A6J5R793_9CAUD|nr:hypothetical protein UFOVP1244_85 [uncultured Caudovirales phage]